MPTAVLARDAVVCLRCQIRAPGSELSPLVSSGVGGYPTFEHEMPQNRSKRPSLQHGQQFLFPMARLGHLLLPWKWMPLSREDSQWSFFAPAASAYGPLQSHHGSTSAFIYGNSNISYAPLSIEIRNLLQTANRYILLIIYSSPSIFWTPPLP